MTRYRRNITLFERVAKQATHLHTWVRCQMVEHGARGVEGDAALGGWPAAHQRNPQHPCGVCAIRLAYAPSHHLSAHVNHALAFIRQASTSGDGWLRERRVPS
jgi:hypothetical protein